MLDKSIPFHTIIMKRPYQPAPRPRALPAGFTLRPYRDGDGLGWAEIETSVLEFDTIEQALACHQNYLPKADELRARQWFVVSPDGDWAATATGWWQDGEKGHIPVVHALGCKPEYQGMGLGRAAATRMLEALYAREPGRDVWLDTQTWSYRAVGLYIDLGFLPMKTATYNDTPNEYDMALPILQEHMRPEAFRRFTETAI